ncbi:branched-chain amino acid transport system II carrier protein [Campylobacter sp. RM12640]|uniref:branched-chain amino acid transport system II carrier protein n=1 Tax=unclassified Campylobacter TaxID=2593542 RepID=UPI0030143395|nr:branched-chain amino acid transport system II carrier protein [Campylobacter sp. RM12640]MBZ7989119.1 branched-chain amino acid transport system II carrier protein [Campylobacter sp. RM12635]
MTKIGKKEFYVVALMLFAMFFGAGNFILPPKLGMDAGNNFYLAILFFCVTGVALPVLGVAAVAKAGTLKELASRVNVTFAVIFVAVIYITIGPLVAIPRASTMPYEIMILPFVDNEYNVYYLAFYSFIYFALNYYICLNPSTMLDTLGKYLTPILLILIAVFFICTLIYSEVNVSIPNQNYTTHPVATAFVEGYQTMDALAALVFGISVVGALKSLGVTNKHQLSLLTIKAGLFSGIILMIVYFALGYLGYVYGNTFKDASNGAILLSLISDDLFGSFGRFILGFTALLACLTTTIGLIGSSASYFSSVTKISYKTWVIIWVVASFVLSIQGLTQILKVSVPILIAIYPIAIVLIILSLINNLINESKIIYRFSVYTAAFIGILNAIDSSILSINDEKILSYLGIAKYLEMLPFYSSMLGWVIPVIVMFILGYIINVFSKKDDF